MNLKESLEILKSYENEDIIIAVKFIERYVSIKEKIKSTKTEVDQESVTSFFSLLDELSLGVNWDLVPSKIVREKFRSIFSGAYRIPDFPSISKETKELRKRVIEEQSPN